MKTQASKTRKRNAKKAVRRGRPIHKRVLVHPVTFFGLLCLGVFIVGWTRLVLAGDYTVSAKVVAPQLQSGATIVEPVDGATITAKHLNVKGNCPDNSYVKLYRNSIFSGTAWCLANTFTIETDLSPATNTLIAKAYNENDEAGPATPSVNVIYRPATTVASAPKINPKANTTIALTPAQDAATDLPLLLSSDYHFQAFAVGSKFTWPLDLEGGTPPYNVTIDWGDNTTSTYYFKTDPTFTISHVYRDSGYFPVKVHSVDSTGVEALQQLAALIKAPGSPGFIATSSKTPPTGHGQVAASGFFQNARGWLWLAWPSYLVVVLMAVSFWLGERQEYVSFLLSKRSKRRRHA